MLPFPLNAILFLNPKLKQCFSSCIYRLWHQAVVVNVVGIDLFLLDQVSTLTFGLLELQSLLFLNQQRFNPSHKPYILQFLSRHPYKLQIYSKRPYNLQFSQPPALQLSSQQASLQFSVSHSTPSQSSHNEPAVSPSTPSQSSPSTTSHPSVSRVNIARKARSKAKGSKLEKLVSAHGVTHLVTFKQKTMMP